MSCRFQRGNHIIIFDMSENTKTLVNARRAWLPRACCRWTVMLWSIGFLLTQQALSAAELDLAEFQLDEQMLKQSVFGDGVNIGLNEKVIDQLMEVHEQLKQAQWLKAFRLMDRYQDQWHDTHVPRADGFSMPITDYFAGLFSRLPADARDNFRLYYAPRARQLLEQANSGPVEDELKTLRKIFSFYLFTDAGRDAGDRLADGLFQQGKFRAAADVWSRIIDHHALTGERELRLLCKMAVAYYRAGDEVSLNRIGAILTQRFSGSTVQFGGVSESVADFQRRWRLDQPVGQPTVAHIARYPRLDSLPTWHVEWESWQRAKQSTGWLVPGVAIDGNSLLVNHGRVLAKYDMATGSPLWNNVTQGKSIDFTELLSSIAHRVRGLGWQRAGTELPSLPQPAELQPVIGVKYAYYLNYENRDQPVLCAVDRKTGTLVWRSSDLNGQKLAGNILATDQYIVSAAYGAESSNELFVLWFSTEGQLVRRQKVGTVQTKTSMYNGAGIQASPLLLQAADHVFLLPSDGAIIALDPENQAIEWAFRFAPAAKQPVASAFWMVRAGEGTRTHFRASARFDENELIFKDADADQMYSLDAAARRLRWKRTIDADSDIVGLDRKFVYLLCGEPDGNCSLLAIDRRTRQLRHAPRLPHNVSQRIAMGDQAIIVSTNRGLYRIDKDTGTPESPYRAGIFRDGPTDLLLTGHTLISLTNRQMDAFSLE
jgi:outer membrane protein assembly factor BamB